MGRTDAGHGGHFAEGRAVGRGCDHAGFFVFHSELCARRGWRFTFDSQRYQKSVDLAAGADAFDDFLPQVAAFVEMDSAEELRFVRDIVPGEVLTVAGAPVFEADCFDVLRCGRNGARRRAGERRAYCRSESQ